MGRSFKEMRRSYAFCLDHVLLQSTKQHPDEAMFRDGSFGRWDVDQEDFRDGKGTMFVHFPKKLRTRWFEKTTDIRQMSGMDPGPHSGVGPSGVSKILSIKASSIVLRLSLPRCLHAVPLKSPATKSTS